MLAATDMTTTTSTPTLNVFLQIVVWTAITVGLIMAIAVVMM